MGFLIRTDFLENEVLNFSRVLELTNFWNEGGVLDLAAHDLLDLAENSLEVLEDRASILYILGWDI